MADETWAGVLSLANVKANSVMAGETAVSTWDTPLQSIINAVIAMVKQEVGCDIVNGSYTAEKVNGSGYSWLDLKHWPIRGVTSVVDSNGTAYTEGATNDFIVEDYCLRATGGYWAKGFENFTVTYTAGNGATIPPDIVQVCYDIIKRKYQLMKGQLHGITNLNHPDGSASYDMRQGFTKDELAILAKYKRPRL